MTRFLQYYTLSYTPLSPIHIGTGDSYEPTNYVIDDGTLYEFDSGGALAACSERDRDELNKIVNGRAGEHMLKAVQTFFYSKREALKPWAVNAIPVLDGVANYYQQRVGQTANREAGGKQVIAKLEIDRTAYNPVTRQPVLFGSSIKGAIRTALLAQHNGKEPLRQIEDYRTGKKRKENNQELQQRLFEFRAGKFELDPLRLLQIGDAAWNQRETLPTAQILLAVNRKKHKVLDQNRQERFSQSEKKDLFQQLECVPAWRYRLFTGQLGVQQLSDLSLTADTKLPKANLRFTLKQIAQSCSAFYVPILQTEIKTLRDRGFINEAWDNDVRQLLAGMKDRLINGEAFLLRVGRHSGAEAVTLNGVRDIKIMEEKDKDTGKQKFSFADNTKTLWLAAETQDQRENLLPFGWLLVEIHPGDGKPADWSELAELCAAQQGPARQWAEKQVQRQAEALAKRQAAEQRLKQEAIERQRRQAEEQAAAEAAEHARAAEQHRLTQLSPIELDIETFLTPIQPQDRDTRLLQELESGRWQGEDAKIVAEKVKALMQQAGKWLPDFAGDNKQKVKLRERSRKVLKYLQD